MNGAAMTYSRGTDLKIMAMDPEPEKETNDECMDDHVDVLTVAHSADI